jgi:tRNA dimethylallyltransferase
LVVIAGPTASGKSALAIALAQRHAGVVINADSAQVYRDLRILTARPTVEEEGRVPHRLFGHVDAADTGHNAARWAAEARAVIAEVHADAKLPILVGGTGLYLRTLLDGIAPVPPIDPAIRAAVRAMPVAAAHAILADLDPAGAARLHRNDTTRVHRALEVARSTGQSIGAWRERREGGIADTVRLAAIVLLPPREWLADRIARRSAAMVGAARVEASALLNRTDVAADAPARRAIGMPEMARLLAGSATEIETVAALDGTTRRYAKRQYTWFSRQPPPAWLRTETILPGEQLTALETMLRR